MPMFEDTMELAQSGELLPKDSSSPSHRLSTPIEGADIPAKPINILTSLHHSRRISEASIRTELCEGPVSSCPSPLPQPLFSHPSPPEPAQDTTAVSPLQHTTPDWDSCGRVPDRTELIEWIECGESPTWVSNRNLESMYHTQSPTHSSRPPSAGTPTTTSTLLPPADITPERIPLKARDHDTETSARLEDGMNIERPRSALHSGDFAHRTSSGGSHRPQSQLLDDAEVRDARFPRPTETVPGNAALPWLATSPPWRQTSFMFDDRSPTTSLAECGVFRSKGSSPSSSVSSTFVYKPPTSPLVQFQSNNDEESSSSTGLMDNIDDAFGDSPSNRPRNVHSSPRRHTVALSHYRSSPSSPYSIPTSYPLSLQSSGSVRQKNTPPYQAHQPHRSLSTTNCSIDHLSSLSSMSSSQTPFPSTFRRPSFTNYTSPLQHASLVGSYEESILRGRMSTNPSKPLDFLAQIGVLGLGAKCKPSLRCPAHVTLPFTAVFYSYATTSYSRSKAEDGPSPYVGLVDLENGLPNLGAEQRSKRKAVMPSRRMSLRTRASQTTEPKMNDAVNAYDAKEPTVTSIPDDEDVTMGDMRVERLDLSEAEGHKSVTSASRSHKRRPHGIRAPPGGSYRIPEQGQIQIIIKNQNKTAVKLFLIPYNLKDMEPGKKTFIRQRSYSAGPIIDDMPVTSGASLERPVLRYLIHLHICCPSRGRYYLYKSIRVVFANRVPDGKENLRNELSFPEPLYSPYKPVRVMPPTPSLPGGSGSHAVLAAEKAYRRRSSGFSFSTHGVSQGLDSFGIMHPPIPAAFPSSKLSKSASSASLQPWSYQKEGDTTALGHDGETVTDDRLFGSATPTKADNFVSVSEKEESSDKAFALSNAAVASNLPLYKKLSKGDIGYGGNAFVSSDNASCEGLLSQRLRTLEVKRAPSVDEN